jgi:hypothetical protein
MLRTLRTIPSPLMRYMSSSMMMTMSSTTELMTSLKQRPPISSPTVYTQPMLVTNFHTSPTVNKETKTKKATKKAEKEKEAQAMSNILEEEEHQTILKGLDSDSRVLTDRMVGHILTKNIKVFKLALENNVVVSKEGLGCIKKRNDLPKYLDPEVKTGRYSAAEDSIIKSNWEKLVDELKLKEEVAVEECI